MKTIIGLFLVVCVAVACDDENMNDSFLGTWTYNSTGSTPQISATFAITGNAPSYTIQNATVSVNGTSSVWSSSEFRGVENGKGAEMIILRKSISDAEALVFFNASIKNNILVTDSVLYQKTNSKVKYENQTLVKN